MNPKGIYEYGSGDTFDYVAGWAQVILWENCNTADGVYNWGKMDSMVADATAAKKQLSFKIRCLDSAPAWVKALPGVTTYNYNMVGNNGTTVVPMVLPWEVQPQLVKFITAVCQRYDGKFTYFTMGGMGIEVETHMPLPTDIGSAMSVAEFTAAYIASSQKVIDTYAANLKLSHFLMAAGAVWKGDEVTPNALLLYGLKYPLFGAMQWGLKAKSGGDFFVNKFIKDNDAGRAGGYQMTGASDGSVGGALGGTLDECLTAGENIGADFVEVYRQDTGNPVNAAVLKKHNDIMLAKKP